MKKNVNSISRYKEYLRDNLSTNRYEHSIRVTECALRMADLYHIDRESVRIAALLHDVTKEKSANWQREILKKEKVTDNYLLTTVPIMHAYTASVFVKEFFNIDDKSILEAIKYHTIGNVNMDDVAKIIFIADYIEPNRSQKDVDLIRDLVGRKSLDEMIIKIIEMTNAYLISIGGQIHPDTNDLYNDLIHKESSTI